MKVTSVSPSPASLTEGDDLCEIDVTNVAIHSVTLLICLCGLAGNGAVLWLLSLKNHNTHIFDVAFTDFLFLLLMAPSALLFVVENVSCSPIVPLAYMRLLFQLSLLSYFWALFRLMLSSKMVDTYKLLQLCCRGNLPERLSWMLWRAQYWAFFSLFNVIPMLTFLCPSKEHCRAGLISMFVVILLLFFIPMAIFRTNDIIRARPVSKKQQPKRRDIVIFIILLFTLLLGICNFLQELGYSLMPSQVVFPITCIHSTIKPFIYFLAGRCWSPCSMDSLRLSLQRVFEEEEENTSCSNDVNTDTVI